MNAKRTLRQVQPDLADTMVVVARSAETARLGELLNYLGSLGRDLRGPIDTVASFAEILAGTPDETISASDRQEYHRAILASARQLQQLLQDVGETAQADQSIELAVEPFDVAQLLEAVAEAVREHAMAKRVSVIVSVIEDLELTGDLIRLRRVVSRLLTDAVNTSQVADFVFMDMVGQRGGGLEIILRGAWIWRPSLSLAEKLIGMHGGSIVFDREAAAGPELRIEFPAQRLRWPKPKELPSATA